MLIPNFHPIDSHLNALNIPAILGVGMCPHLFGLMGKVMKKRPDTRGRPFDHIFIPDN